MRLLNIPQTVYQPNGQVINCFASGNEYFNFLHDKNGCLIIQNAISGYYSYAIYIDGQYKASEYIVTEDTLNNINVSLIHPEIITTESIKKPTINNNDNTKLNAKYLPQIVNTPKKGLINSITVFVRFSDESEFTTQLADYQNMFNNSTANYNSMYNYMQSVSYNQLSIVSYFYPVTATTTVVSYQDSHPRAYYQPYNAVTNPSGYTEDQRTEREQTLIKNATDAISGQVPLSINVDQDNDGFVDNICFIIKGAPGAWNTILWPHKWNLFSQTAYIHSSRVGVYNVQLQDVLDVGVICHETLHSIGLPDLYHYSYDGLQPVYKWDIMEWDLNPPQQTGAYMKYRYGTWINSIPEITTSGTYTLNPLTSPTNNAYMIRSNLSNTQYFVVEYRLKNNIFENSLPGSGLLVYRINTAQDGKGNKDGPPDEVYIYRPGGSTTLNGDPSIANLSSDVGRTTIGGPGNPLYFADGTPSEIVISNVGSAGDTISFDITLAPPPTKSADVEISNVVSPNFVYVGQQFNYVVTIINNGPNTSEGVVFTHDISDKVSYINATTTKGTCSLSGGKVTATIGDMVSGEIVTVTITLRADIIGTINNVFSAFGSTYDPDLSNNTELTTTEIRSNTVSQLSTGIVEKCHGLCGINIYLKNTTATLVNIPISIYDWSSGIPVLLKIEVVAVNPNSINSILIKAKDLPMLYEIVFDDVVDGIRIKIEDVYKDCCGYYKCIVFTTNDLIVYQ